MTENPTRYPVRVDASLDDSLSRGLWLVKWLLLIPHYVVLAFLWLGFAVVSVIAFFAILITGRYPRALFDYNVGVLRWSWRVHYYGYGALGTDRYPPFTLADVPDYPAHLEVPYPERLSRGLVLVKWWLLALPHYVVVAVFVGGGIWLGTGTDGIWDEDWGFGGLVALLVFVAGVVLLFTGRYPRGLYDFVLGMDRWVLRVAAYAGLMTDAYPPFRMDMGGPDPGSMPMVPGPAAPVGGGTVHPAGQEGPGRRPHGSWSAGRVVTLVLGALLLATATGVVGAGGGLLWADQTQRDDDGFLRSPASELSTDRYALTAEGVVIDGEGLDWGLDEVLGTARLEVTSAGSSEAIFVGLGRTSEVSRYLEGVGRRELENLGPEWQGDNLVIGPTNDVPGGAPATSPGDADVWTASASGTGTQTIEWRPEDGDWTVVVMRPDGGAGIDVDVRAGVTAPGLTWFSWTLIGVGAVIGLAGGLLVVLAARRPRPVPPSGGQPAERVAPPPVPAGGEAVGATSHAGPETSAPSGPPGSGG